MTYYKRYETITAGELKALRWRHCLAMLSKPQRVFYWNIHYSWVWVDAYLSEDGFSAKILDHDNPLFDWILIEQPLPTVDELMKHVWKTCAVSFKNWEHISWVLWKQKYDRYNTVDLKIDESTTCPLYDEYWKPYFENIEIYKDETVDSSKIEHTKVDKKHTYIEKIVRNPEVTELSNKVNEVRDVLNTIIDNQWLNQNTK